MKKAFWCPVKYQLQLLTIDLLGPQETHLCCSRSLWEFWQEAVECTHALLALEFRISLEMLCVSLLSCWLLLFPHFASWVGYCPSLTVLHLLTAPRERRRGATWHHLSIFFEKSRASGNKQKACQGAAKRGWR